MITKDHGELGLNIIDINRTIISTYLSRNPISSENLLDFFKEILFSYAGIIACCICVTPGLEVDSAQDRLTKDLINSVENIINKKLNESQK